MKESRKTRASLAVYPGTFDPITNGHIDIIRRSLKIFSAVTVAVAHNPRKQPLFSLNERVSMVREATGFERLEVEPFTGLLVNYVRQKGARAIIRGLRAVSDFEYEFQMALMNRKLAAEVETVFLMPSEEYSYLTSTIVKEVASLSGDVTKFVPPAVMKRLAQKLRGK